jgi:hypothetical protein
MRAFTALTARATPRARACRASRHMVVHTDLFVQPTGEITIVRPAKTNTGDPDVAQCVGQAIKDAGAAGWSPGEGGIVTAVATVDPG